MHMQMALSRHNSTTSTHRYFHPQASWIGRGRPMHTRRPHPPTRHIQVQARALALRFFCRQVRQQPSTNLSSLLPPATKFTDFKFPSSSLPMRVRPAAHLVHNDYIAMYKEAITRMKNLPPDDPRHFMQLAKVHESPHLEAHVHSSWLFLPWHRCFLYFFERILGKLVEEETFALPFWNWDSPCGMVLPSIYTDPSPPLNDEIRNWKHQPPVVVDLNYAGCAYLNDTQQQREEEDVIARNLATMHKQMVSGGKTARLFMGAPHREGNRPSPGAGSLELIPHNTLHNWIGDSTHQKEDMGNFYSSGWDPIFYAHHSNIDRLWDVWKTLPGGKRRDFTDLDWLDSSFLFYDENAELVRVNVRDCLDPGELRYTYQQVDKPWLTPKPAATKARKAKAPKKVEGETKFPRKLDSVVKVLVSRPRKSRSREEKDDEEEVLVIDGVELERDVAVKFDVYINLEEEESRAGPEASEYVGSFVHGHGKREELMKPSLMLGITDALKDLGADDDDEVLVTIVPRQGMDVVSVGRLKIEFIS